MSWWQWALAGAGAELCLVALALALCAAAAGPEHPAVAEAERILRTARGAVRR